MAIVEQRDYHVTTGKLRELVRLYETEGIAIEAEVLGGFVGAFTTDIGALSTYTSMWRYDDLTQREQRRATLQARDDWKAFLAARSSATSCRRTSSGPSCTSPARPRASSPVRRS